MRKLFITVAAFSVITASAFSQGLVTMVAGIGSSTKMSTNSIPGGASTGVTGANAGGNFYYALFASATATSVAGQTTAVSSSSLKYVFDNPAGWTLVGYGTNSNSAGRVVNAFQGSSQSSLNTDGSMSVSGIAGGNTAQFVVVGWEISAYGNNYGTTIGSLKNAYDSGNFFGWIGQSDVSGPLTLGDGGLNSTTDPFGTGTGQISGFLLGMAAIPEPSTMMLVGLGGFSFYAFRRNKK